MKVYIGYDPREDRAYKIAEQSMRAYATIPLDVEPLDRRNPIISSRATETRHGQLWCPFSDAPMSTDFAIARFAIPFICSDDWALFIDCDVLFRADVAELFALCDERFAVQVVKHHHKPIEGHKMDYKIQSTYPRKNWSSVVLWNLKHKGHKRFTKQMLLSQPGRDLHAFSWLKDDEIGSLPKEWNFLVGVDFLTSLPGPVKLMHFTLGGPLFNRYDDMTCDEAMLEAMNGQFPEVSSRRRAVG